jgi:hypothetical protein
MGPYVQEVAFTYSLVGRPGLLSGLIRFLFALETRRRLVDLKRAAEA